MKKALIIFFFTAVSCTTSIKNYEGYIYEYNTKIPLSNIEICPEHTSENKKCVKTDKKGFFKMDLNSMQHIYVYINGNLSDSIQTIRTSGGEKINYYFINGRKDTAYIDMKQKKIIRQ